MEKKLKSIQRVELSCSEIPVHCPFCGQVVLNVAGATDSAVPDNPVTPCPHTLFMAHDEAFEYRSKKFNENIGLQEKPDDPMPDLGEDSYDSFTDKVTLGNAIKSAIYTPAPSFFEAYVGFAPLE